MCRTLAASSMPSVRAWRTLGRGSALELEPARHGGKGKINTLTGAAMLYRMLRFFNAMTVCQLLNAAMLKTLTSPSKVLRQ